MNSFRLERLRAVLSRLLATSIAFILPLIGGFAFTWAFSPSIHSKNFPWITGRALGIAGYLSLTALVAVGLWLRHPWRLRLQFGHAETRLRVHATLGLATVALILGHLIFLATDRYAGVGWAGAFVPGLSHYRRVPVGLGVGAFEFLLLVGATARFAGRRWTRHWLGIHQLASVTFALSWFHGVLAGTDTAALRLVYVVTGALVTLLIVSRAFVARTGSTRGGFANNATKSREELPDDRFIGASR